MKESLGNCGSSQVEHNTDEIGFTGSRFQLKGSDRAEKLILLPADTDASSSDQSGISPMYTVAQAAQLLGLPVTWIYERTRTSAIPHHKFGKYIRFTPSDIAAILSSFSRGPKTQVGPSPTGVSA